MEMKQMEAVPQIIFERMLHFIHFLRSKGFAITTGETLAAFRALKKIDVFDETEIFFALRTVLSSNRMERDRFEQLFTAFFHGAQTHSGIAETANGKQTNANGKDGKETTEKEETFVKTNTTSEDTTEQVGRTNHFDGAMEKKETSFLQAVRQSQISSKEFTTIAVPSDHYADMVKAARSFIQHIQLKPNRRLQARPDGQRIDLRRTFRKSLTTGGYPIDLAKIGHRKYKARFVLLCDGSRSMAPYTQLFLQFAAALHREAEQTELFLFSTKVRRVTHLLTKQYPLHNLSITKLGPEWGGGTSIGNALTDVIQGYRLPLKSSQTIFIIFSDGLESGDLKYLEQGMHTLKQQVNSVIWLNPLLGKPGYEPLARGMQLALKYIDIFAEAHEVESFYKLATLMKRRRGRF